MVRSMPSDVAERSEYERALELARGALNPIVLGATLLSFCGFAGPMLVRTKLGLPALSLDVSSFAHMAASTLGVLMAKWAFDLKQEETSTISFEALRPVVRRLLIVAPYRRIAAALSLVLLMLQVLATFQRDTRLEVFAALSRYGLGVELVDVSGLVRAEKAAVERIRGVGGAPITEERAANYEEMLVRSNRAAIREFTRSLSEAPSKPVLVHAHAGFGKSEIVDGLIESLRGQERALVKISLRSVADASLSRGPDEDVYAELGLREESVNTPDSPLGTLPQLTGNFSWVDLEQVFKASGSTKAATMFLLDDLDELHQATATRIIDSSVRYLAQRPRHQIVILGRTEAFTPYMTHHLVNAAASVTCLDGSLAQPTYYDGEVEIRVRDYLEWAILKEKKHQHLGVPPGDGARTVLDGIIEEVTAHLEEHLELKPYLWQMMGAAAQSKLLIEDVLFDLYPTNTPPARHLARSSQNQVKRWIFEELLQRNEDSHDRPTSTADGRGAGYVRALRQIARKYAGGVGDDGFFMLEAGGEVEIGGVTLPERKVLERSGLIDMRPAKSSRDASYRFEPQWLHRYLVQS